LEFGEVVQTQKTAAGRDREIDRAPLLGWPDDCVSARRSERARLADYSGEEVQRMPNETVGL
jgi:hypothetical protein